jgi:hypothetical protein
MRTQVTEAWMTCGCAGQYDRGAIKERGRYNHPSLEATNRDTESVTPTLKLTTGGDAVQ